MSQVGFSERAGNRISVRKAGSRRVMMEGLEARLLMSHTHAGVATHDFQIYHKQGSNKPALSAGPVGFTPARMRHAYAIDSVLFGAVTGDGTGQTIAIVDAYDAPSIVADLHTFDVTFGLTDPTLTVINQTGGTTRPPADTANKGNSWAVETSLDVEWAHVVAPKANILLVLANSASDADLYKAVDTARGWAGVSVVSMSWGGDETSADSANDVHFTTPSSHNGVTFVASSGDSGRYSYGQNSTIAVGYPAVSPNVVSVGGTFLNADASGNYISESGWGSGTTSGTAGGAGGGISKYAAQPSYQIGKVTGSTTKRVVPDVAFDADPNSGVAVIDTWDFGTSTPWLQVGGTSLAAPMWAGVVAIVDQGRAINGKGTLDSRNDTLPMLYNLPSSDFHDITTGNNGYAAGVGYDLVTGRGTPIVNLLAKDMVGVPTPAIGSFTVSPTAVQTGASVTLTASGVTEVGGTISSVKFYRESNGTSGLQTAADTLIGTGVQNGTTWTIGASTTGLAAGTYTYYAVATDTANVSGGAYAATLTVTAAAPANNNFASATVVSGSSFNVSGSNVGATKETGEPNIGGNAGGKSVWWTWTAPSAGKVTVTTKGSSFDTLLSVFTGSAVNALTSIASNDDVSSSDRTSSVTFTAVAGTVYRIAVDGYAGASGSIVLNLAQAPAPANNNFSAATVISGNLLTWTGTNVGATKETGEPSHAGNAGGASVWLKWTATTTRTVTLTTAGSSFDTTLAVYTGTSVSTLTTIKSNDDASSGVLTSSLTFNAVAGTTYYIAIDGYNGATGNITLNLS